MTPAYRLALILALSCALCGCDLRQQLDIGSAKAVEELQEGHNDMVRVLRRVAGGQEAIAGTLAEQHPGVAAYRAAATEASRTVAQAALLQDATLDPYASLGDLGGILASLGDLLSPEGIAGIVMAMMGLGGIGTAVQQRSKAKKHLALAQEVAELHPDQARERMKRA